MLNLLKLGETQQVPYNLHMKGMKGCRFPWMVQNSGLRLNLSLDLVVFSDCQHGKNYEIQRGSLPL